ncbi:MAG: class I SAM-dependent methyltransferase [Candidatus Paceibacterota bacterium]
MNLRDNINSSFKKYAPQCYWGDPLDVRYFLCEKLSKFHNKKILDIGCGIGIIISCMPKDNEIFGIDFDQTLVEIAKKLNPKADINKQDMFNLQFEEQFFDIIVLADVLPQYDFACQKTSREMISHVKKFLKPEGAILLTTPNGNNAYFSRKHKISAKNLKELIKDFDFELFGYNPFPIQLDHILKYLPFWPSFLEYLMYKKIGLTRAVGLFAELKNRN